MTIHAVRLLWLSKQQLFRTAAIADPVPIHGSDPGGEPISVYQTDA
jgi:hypothetical protein